MLKILEIKRKGLFKNTALLEAISSGVRVAVEFNSVFVNNEWISRSELRVEAGDRFIGLVDKTISAGSTLHFRDVENLRPH